MSYFHPDRMPVLPARRRKAARRQLEDVVRRSGARSGRRHGKPAAVVAGAAAMVLATGAAAFAIASYQPLTNKSQARCYTVADATDGYYTMVFAPGTLGGRSEVRRAHDACAALYQQGFLRVGANERAKSSTGSHRIPALVVCTLHDGSAAVFPGSPGTCANLGLPAAVRSAGRSGR
ncbi:MAG TPA: hypothetical protein VF834_10260 [Streptosporangiaceae bacterium]